ncbi:hypothetical protein AX16_004094 [Volvariella volvacea WC 439]|nr:hypothetical protein AX16_004094 [Volvariella volvacea WC 439]
MLHSEHRSKAKSTSVHLILDMVVTLQSARGIIGLVGSTVDEFAHEGLRSAAPHFPSPISFQPPYHITFFSKEELKQISMEKMRSLDADTRFVHAIGVGGHHKRGVYFVVIIWAAGQTIRKQFGLPPKDFHITLSTQDDHNISKGIDSLLPGQFPLSPSADLLDHLAYTLFIAGHYGEAQQYSKDLILQVPDSHRGFLRIADAALSEGKFKLAMLAYGCAHERADEERVKNYALRKLIICSKQTEWGVVSLEHETHQVPAEIGKFLLKPWSADLRTAITDANITPTLQLEPRESLYIPHWALGSSTPTWYKLPRFFRWLIPYHIAIMSTPRREEDIDALASSALGISHILTLTEETPLPAAWFLSRPVTNTFLPIANYHAPSIEQVDLVMRLISNHNNAPMLIHCGGGKGRAGTVAACYLSAFGFSRPRYDQERPELSAAEAISTLRHLRPGSIETSQQEDFVSKWCSTIWKRQSVYPSLPSEPGPCPLEIEGTLGKEYDLLVLVGLPGSGKSWFSKALLARNQSGWQRISQDDSGSRAFCETEIGRARGRVLLDRCNTAATDRKYWLDLASNWCKHPICVWFDYDVELCTSRAQMRPDHPTLPPGSRVRNAIDQMQKTFSRPQLTEGFDAIAIVKSFAAAQELVGLLSPPVTIYKFPRTPHLINLGAVSEDDIIADNLSLLNFGSEGANIVITEKVDGANMGFSLSSDRSNIIVQNRSHYVNSSSHEQFKKLGQWVDQHRADLYHVLDRDPYFAERYILFGEWMFATHSIPYMTLPDRFLAFDLYDRTRDVWADRRTLERLLKGTGIQLVPVIQEGSAIPSEAELKSLVQGQSRFWEGRIEGAYVKVEKGGFVISRGKVVRGDFIAGNEHWTRGKLRVNGLAREEEPTT